MGLRVFFLIISVSYLLPNLWMAYNLFVYPRGICSPEKTQQCKSWLWVGGRYKYLNLDTYQYTRSQDPSKVPNFICNMCTLFNFSSREKQQNVSKGAEHSQGDEGTSQALGAASRAHASLKEL